MVAITKVARKDNRKHIRIPLLVPVEVRTGADGRVVYAGVTTEIARDSLRFSTTSWDELVPGTLLEIDLHNEGVFTELLPAGRMSFRAKVIRVDRPTLLNGRPGARAHKVPRGVACTVEHNQGLALATNQESLRSRFQGLWRTGRREVALEASSTLGVR